MAKQNINSKEGFTIIEVVLVLAIAGLIFLMVFVALPALQRSQRDTQRRNDMSRVDTSLVQWQTNHSTDSNNLPQGPSYYKGSDYIDKSSESDNVNCGTGASANVACVFVRDYMNSGSSDVGKKNEFRDPDGDAYAVFITENWNVSTSGITQTPSGTDGKSKLVDSEVSGGYTIGGEDAFSQRIVYIVPGGKCSGSSVVKSERRHFAILYRLEGAGTYCIDDQ
jgi:prepilin-type N-terminal cleavage/methylation domain-containing protein